MKFEIVGEDYRKLHCIDGDDMEDLGDSEDDDSDDESSDDDTEDDDDDVDDDGVDVD